MYHFILTPIRQMPPVSHKNLDYSIKPLAKSIVKIIPKFSRFLQYQLKRVTQNLNAVSELY